MIDWSKPVVKTDPVVLAEWMSELRADVDKMRAQGDWCQALCDIKALCCEAENALRVCHYGRARGYLEEAAFKWYMVNR